MTPKHDKINWFIKKELLKDVTKFSQLEKKFSRLLTDKEKGDALEVFAEAWLALNPVTQAEEVWPFEQIPSKLKRELRLDTKKDMGVDGLVKTGTGENHAYQVKFRSGRPALTWRELSTFVGLADRTDRKLVFTNCEKLPPLLEKREDVFSVRGSNLDELGPEDFERMLVWLKTGRVKPEPKRMPREDQLEAMEKIEEAFKDKREKRATAVMACGTGKTVTALWTAERLGYKKILVLVPSLALMSQTLHEWMKETSWKKVSYICVCSDKTVDRGMDNWEVRQSDLPFPVGTNSVAVEEFFSKRTGGVKIVFSTYQSAQVVAEGLNGRQFDLGVFDEAHKTAGRQGTKFAFALKDENIPIKKRLFLTATPRHFNVLKKDKEGEAEFVYSMNDKSVYGRRVYELPFAEAAKKKIICGYKVLISVVTSEEVDEEIMKKGTVVVGNEEVVARQVANQLALKRAVEKFPVKKAFTFHSFVKSAASFTSDGPEGLKTHLPEFETFHVSGAMPVSDRESLLHEFKDSKKSVMSNARCLTEGVNVPVVDMVAFMSPKKSRVDIVQATGRAMRKAGRKKKGYILIPLFLQKAKDESIEEALERTDFGEVWDVLQAMSEQDEVLAEIISQAVFEKAKTKVKGYDDRKFKEKVEVLGPSVSLERLERAVTAKCIDRLGISWDVRYGELVTYKKEHGDCNVPDNLPSNPKLAVWVSHQRVFYKKGLLGQHKIEKLENLGFCWDILEAQWEVMFQELLAYKEKFGDCNVRQRESEYAGLAAWVSRQRQEYKKHKLPPDKVKRLKALGIAWDAREVYWATMFGELLKFKAKYNHCNVTQSYSDNPQLAMWVKTQRVSYRKRRLGKDTVKRLEDAGFVWNPDESQWEKMFQELVRFKEKHGHCNVPLGSPNKTLFGSWISNQRSDYKKGNLNRNKVQKLSKLGFVWNTSEAQWEEKYQELVDYKQEHGNCNVLSGYSENPRLGLWVANQRHRKDKLDKSKIRRLEKLGFMWKPYESFWEEKFQELVGYKKKYGHCNVPDKCEKYPSLGVWVGSQRSAYKRGKLSDRKTRRLEELGFEWRPDETYWEERYQELVSYTQEHGTCFVPQGYPGNPQLGAWVSGQRQRKDKLGQDKIKKLEELGFVWRAREDKWENKFQELTAFKKEHGHCNVPRSYSENPLLASWVAIQRTANKKGNLNQDRIKRLEKMGFKWVPHEAQWEEKYQELADYKKKYGNCNAPFICPENPPLGRWVSKQRTANNKGNGRLSQDRIDRLSLLGFEWNPEEDRWETMFQELLEYKGRHGDCKVRASGPEYPKLCMWLSNQRAFERRGKLRPNRKQRLDELDLGWRR